MKELSIFVDESGDFGEYEKHSPYYIITMVFHDQVYPINDDSGGGFNMHLNFDRRND